MLEKNFRKQVIKYLKEKYERKIKIISVEGLANGCSDLLLCFNGNFVALELKGDNKYYDLTEQQRLFLKKVREAGGISICLRYTENWKELLDKYLTQQTFYVIDEEDYYNIPKNS